VTTTTTTRTSNIPCYPSSPSALQFGLVVAQRWRNSSTKKEGAVWLGSLDYRIRRFPNSYSCVVVPARVAAVLMGGACLLFSFHLSFRSGRSGTLWWKDLEATREMQYEPYISQFTSLSSLLSYVLFRPYPRLPWSPSSKESSSATRPCTRLRGAARGNPHPSISSSFFFVPRTPIDGDNEASNAAPEMPL